MLLFYDVTAIPIFFRALLLRFAYPLSERLGKKRAYLIELKKQIYMLVRNLVDIEKYRKKGKGRRYCLGARLYFIPCRSSYFAIGRF